MLAEAVAEVQYAASLIGWFANLGEMAMQGETIAPANAAVSMYTIKQPIGDGGVSVAVESAVGDGDKKDCACSGT